MRGLVAFGEEAVAALFGLSEHGGVFGRLAKRGQYGIELQVVVATESAFDRGLDQARCKFVSETVVEGDRLGESRLGVMKRKKIFLGLLQKLVGARRPEIGIASLQSAGVEERAVVKLAHPTKGLGCFPIVQEKANF